MKEVKMIVNYKTIAYYNSLYYLYNKVKSNEPRYFLSFNGDGAQKKLEAFKEKIKKLGFNIQIESTSNKYIHYLMIDFSNCITGDNRITLFKKIIKNYKEIIKSDTVKIVIGEIKNNSKVQICNLDINNKETIGEDDSLDQIFKKLEVGFISIDLLKKKTKGYSQVTQKDVNNIFPTLFKVKFEDVENNIKSLIEKDYNEDNIIQLYNKKIDLVCVSNNLKNSIVFEFINKGLNVSEEIFIIDQDNDILLTEKKGGGEGEKEHFVEYEESFKEEMEDVIHSCLNRDLDLYNLDN